MLIGYERLRGVVGAGSYDELQRSHRGSIEDYLGNGEKSRRPDFLHRPYRCTHDALIPEPVHNTRQIHHRRVSWD